MIGEFRAPAASDLRDGNEGTVNSFESRLLLTVDIEWTSMTRRLHRYTYSDYVALEQDSSTKHEFLDGEIYAMGGGTEEHSALAAEVLYVLISAVRGKPCRVHTSDLRIYVEAAGLATFPDGSVICGPLQQHDPSPRTTALNPTVLLEITSDSSEEYDNTVKLEYYRASPCITRLHHRLASRTPDHRT